MRRLLFSCALLIGTVFAASAQLFHVGDELPLYTPIGNKTLADYKGTLVILEFWATWSGASQTPLPRFRALMETYKNQVAIVLVSSTITGDDTSRLLTKNYYRKHGKKVEGFPQVKNDTLLSTLFDHSVVPYYVWIGPDGKLIGYTASDQVTAENIDIVLITGALDPSMQEKRPVSF